MRPKPSSSDPALFDLVDQQNPSRTDGGTAVDSAKDTGSVTCLPDESAPLIEAPSCNPRIQRIDLDPEEGGPFYRASCLDGWVFDSTTGGREQQRETYLALWEHLGVEWEGRPVFHSPARFSPMVYGQHRAFVAKYYPRKFDGPTLSVFQPCSEGAEIDKVDGVDTQHGCSGIVPDGRSELHGAPDLCVCGCHDDGGSDRPQRCQISQNGCTEIATADVESDVTGKRRYCGEHFTELRIAQALEIEVGNRSYYESRVGWEGVRAQDAYPSDPHGEPGSSESYLWHVVGTGSKIGRRDPSKLLAQWDQLGSARRRQFRAHDIDRIWSGMVDACVAAGYKATRTNSAPMDVVEQVLTNLDVRDSRKSAGNDLSTLF